MINLWQQLFRVEQRMTTGGPHSYLRRMNDSNACSAEHAGTRGNPGSASSRYSDGPWAEIFGNREPGERRFWLIKSEPDVFSFGDLMKCKGRRSHWDGVRNATARNFLRDGMRKGDRCLFYHSNARPSAVVGACEVVREGYPDHTAFDPQDEHFDPKSDRNSPTWYMVDVRAIQPFPKYVSLEQIKVDRSLREMTLLRISRLSVVPVTRLEWNRICELGGCPELRD